ncbi:hypothetical protein F5X98DRAFT_279293 [Xylaria grammica]|nr:hypothetical protein F5X98DRAFT_279293 [Xylaria grammica]
MTFRPALRPFSGIITKIPSTPNTLRPPIPTMRSRYSHMYFPEGIGKQSKEQSNARPRPLIPHEFQIQRALLEERFRPCGYIADLRASNVARNSNITVAHQDIRSNGPLFSFARQELSADPEQAKKQWRRMCVEYNLKEKSAAILWEENQDLWNRWKKAQIERKTIKEELRKELEEEAAAKCKTTEERTGKERGENSLLPKVCKKEPEGMETIKSVYYDWNEPGTWCRDPRRLAEKQGAAKGSINRHEHRARLLAFGMGVLSMATCDALLAFTNY